MHKVVELISRTPEFEVTSTLCGALQTYADLVALHWDRAPVMVEGRIPSLGSSGWSLRVRHSDPSYPHLLGQHGSGTDGVYGTVYLSHATRAMVPASVVLSHELAEMIVNPYGNLAAVDANNEAWALEVCDPVENDWVYLPDHPGIPLSNFVLPDFYLVKPESDRGRYSLDGKVSKAFTLRPGGYRQILVPKVGWRREMARKES